jgi:ribose transport system substrate-binding protein
MNQTKRRTGLALAAFLTAAPMAMAQDISIAGVLSNTQDPFWTSIGCGAKAKGAELGVAVEIFSSTTMDAAPMTANFNAALLSQPDGFFGTPAASNQFVTQYGELMAAGVPVVTGNPTDPASTYGVVWSSGDTEPYLAELLDLAPVSEGKVLVLGGIPGLVPLEMRYEPFVKAMLEARPGLSEIERLYTTFDVNKATSGVQAALVANPDLTLVIASNGPDAIGAAAALKATGMAGKVTLVAFDAVPPQVAALKEGTITALIAQSPAQIGAVTVQRIVDYLKSGATGPVPVSTDFIGIPQRLLTPANVDDPVNADYIYKPEC